MKKWPVIMNSPKYPRTESPDSIPIVTPCCARVAPGTERLSTPGLNREKTPDRSTTADAGKKQFTNGS